MTYLSQRIITITKGRLHESFDLTKSVGSFAGTNSYLVLMQHYQTHVLDISAIINQKKQLDLSQPIGTGLSSLYSDSFFETYGVDYVPLTNTSGLYPKRLNVFNPVAHSDYQVQFTSVNTPQIVDDPSRKGFLDDLVITSSTKDLQHCLVAVNGVFHRTDYQADTKSLYVLDGFRTCRISGGKDIVVVDTSGVGGHSIIPLTSNNVSINDYNQSHVVTTTQSLKDCTVMAIIDGYFYHIDQQILSIKDEYHLVLHPHKMPLVQQFRHNPRTLYVPDRLGADVPQSSRKYQDFYQTQFINTSVLPTTMFTTSDFEYSRLTAYHSFLVVIPNSNLYQIETAVQATGTPQFYQDLSNKPLSGMISYGSGLCPSYLLWKDPHERKSIFIPHQDGDLDRQDETVNPSFIARLTPEPKVSAYIPLRFVDYVIG